MKNELSLVFKVIEKSENREEIAEGTITVGAEPARPKSKKGKKKR